MAGPRKSTASEKSLNIRRAVRASFAEADHPSVFTALDRYRWNEATRVRLAILALSDGQLARLKELVKQANLDYRDILASAETPARLVTKQKMAARYRSLGIPMPRDLARSLPPAPPTPVPATPEIPSRDQPASQTHRRR